MELCKTFLDPFGNRRVSNADFRADVQVDVLIAESNAGLGMWPRRVEALTTRVAASDHTKEDAAFAAADRRAAPAAPPAANAADANDGSSS